MIYACRNKFVDFPSEFYDHVINSFRIRKFEIGDRFVSVVRRLSVVLCHQSSIFVVGKLKILLAGGAPPPQTPPLLGGPSAPPDPPEFL